MTLNELITILKKSELKQLSIVDDNEAIVGLINLGLIELYKRFPIKTREFLITPDGTTTTFTLPADCMWILQAFREADSNENKPINLPINDDENPLSINTISWNEVQIPLAVKDVTISIIYSAAPVLFVYDANDNSYLDIEIPLPMQMIEPLVEFVGYKANATVSDPTNMEDDVRYRRFEASCERVTLFSMYNTQGLQLTNKFYNRGFA